MDVRQHAALRNGDVTEQLVQLLVVSVGDKRSNVVSVVASWEFENEIADLY